MLNYFIGVVIQINVYSNHKNLPFILELFMFGKFRYHCLILV